MIAFRRYDLERQPVKGRAHAEGFVDDGLQVGEGEGLGVGDARTGNKAGGDAFVDFTLQPVVGARVGAEVEKAGTDAGGGGVGAGEDLEDGFGLALSLGEAAADEGALL